MPWVTCTRCEYVPVWLPEGSSVEAVCSCCAKDSAGPKQAPKEAVDYPPVVLPDC